MATRDAAKAMGLPDYGLTEGSVADLVLFAGKTPAEIICYQRKRLAVIKRGKLVAANGRLVGDDAGVA